MTEFHQGIRSNGTRWFKIDGRFVSEKVWHTKKYAPSPERKAPSYVYIVRGIARPRSKSDARTPDLVADHFFYSEEDVENIDEMEEVLNEKYPSWVHFDTYTERVKQE